MRRHAIAIKREAPDDEIRFAVHVEDRIQIILEDTVAFLLLPASEAASARRDVLFDYVDDVYLMLAVSV